MIRYSTALLTLLATFLVAAPSLYSQIVSLELVNGDKIQGELSGYREGKYLIRSDGAIREIPDSTIAHVIVIEEIGPPSAKTDPPPRLSDPPINERETTIALVRRLINQSSQSSLEETGELLVRLARDFPDDREIADLSQEWDYRRTIMEVDRTSDLPTRRAILAALIERLTNADFRTQATRALETVDAAIQSRQALPISGAKAEDYFPISAGLWYEYERVGENIVEKITIDSVIDDDGAKKIYLTHDKSYKSYRTSQSFQLFCVNGNFAKDPSGTKDILMKSPIRVGDRWDWKETNSTFSRSYVSVSEQVTTAAGVFPNCLVIELTSATVFPNGAEMTMKSVSYYAPRVGLVKHVVHDQQQQTHVMELRNYGLHERTYAIPPTTPDQGK